MRSMKKVMSALLTAAMVCASTFPAFATSTGDGNQIPAKSTSTATVQVGTGNANDELSAYKVVEAKFDETANDLTFEFSGTFKAFQESEKGQAYKDLTPDEYSRYVDSEAAGVENDLRALLGGFSAYIKSQDPMPEAAYTATTGENKTATFTDVAMGQYIILGSGNTSGAYVYQTVTAEVIPTANPADNNYLIYPSYNVTMKTTEPTADKTIDATTTTADGEKQTADIGDSVAYTLKATVPTYSKGAVNTTFFMGDTLSSGLSWDFTKEVVVKAFTENSADGAELVRGKDYTIIWSGQKMYIDFKYDNIKAYASVTAQYSAILNEKALIGTAEGNVNDYNLVYSNDPFSGSTYEPTVPENPDQPDTPTDPERPVVPENPDDPQSPTPGYGHKYDKETVYTYALLINKYQDGDKNVRLAGATFDVYTTYNAGTNTWEGLVGTITTDATGYATLEGLKAGTYHLKETKAPAGYKLLTTDTEIALNEAMATTKATTTRDIAYTSEISEASIKAQARDEEGNLLYFQDDNETVGTDKTDKPAYVKAVTVKVETENIDPEGGAGSGYFAQDVPNVPGSSLPSTGGIGTTIFYVVGGCLMLLAAVLFITKKRMEGRN